MFEYLSLQAVFTPNNYAVSKCPMPRESTVIWIYMFGGALLFLWIALTYRRLCRRSRWFRANQEALKLSLEITSVLFLCVSRTLQKRLFCLAKYRIVIKTGGTTAFLQCQEPYLHITSPSFVYCMHFLCKEDTCSCYQSQNVLYHIVGKTCRLFEVKVEM